MIVKFFIVISAVLVASASYAAQLEITVGGSAYKGGPAFAAYIGQNKIGDGTASDNFGSSGETFTFDVSEDLLRDNAPLDIRFTNDLKEDGGDRNLAILGVKLAGHTFSPRDISVLRSGVLQGRENAFLSRSDDVAQALAPDGGWLSTCLGEVVIQFPSGGSAMQDGAVPKDMEPLIDTAVSGACGVIVTGYSSTGGGTARNQIISEQRAKAVSDYLVSIGVAEDVIKSSGAGSTSQFGIAELNQRVLVTLSVDGD